jgi:hypothetical protein
VAREVDFAIAGRAFDQRADDQPHHAVQKPVAAQADAQQIAAPHELDRVQIAQRPAERGRFGAITGKIVCAEQRPGGGTEAFVVDRARHEPGARAPQRR